MEAKSDLSAWRQKRHNDLSQRRLLSSEGIELECLANRQQVEEAAKDLATKKEKRKRILQQLTHTFGTKPELIQPFIKINTSLPTLISLLSGNDTVLQLEAVSCLTNMAAGSEDDRDVLCKMAAPYLVTYLGGSNPLLQDQCAWCVGNLATDSYSRVDYLASLGVIHQLVQLLQSSSSQVVQSAAFALVNFAKSENVLRNLVSENIMPALESHLVSDQENYPILTELAWIVFYLSAESWCIRQIRETNIPEKTAACFIHATRNDIQKYQLITPLVRGLANMCCDFELTSRVLLCNDLLPQISEVINTAPEAHVRKEALWLLTNIAANPEHSESIMRTGLLKSIIHSLASTTDIKVQACLCLCNLLSYSNDYCECACTEGVIQSLVPLIGHPHQPVTKAALWLIEILITSQQRLNRFDSSHGREALETLIRHEASDKNINEQTADKITTGQQISQMAKDLITQYYQC